jgi:YesN/AraC family two-component response regulator
MGIFMYSIAYYLSGVHWRKVAQPAPKYQASNLKDAVKPDMQQRLEQLMEVEKLYLHNELRIKDLASKLDLSSHHVSQLINEQYGCSFFDFVNKYRIQEAKKLIQSSPDKNLLQIAFDAGFNNKTSFVNAFKKFESQTPSAFKKAL